METIRQSKLARLLQRDLGDIFLAEARNHLDGAMITVTTVRVSRDFSTAKVFLSIFAAPDKQALLGKIIAHTREIRYQLGNRIKNQVRIVPELQFHLDDSLDYIEHLDELLKQ
ncbi:MAG: 30S ribosome-binding factor RbfA [Bacteroidales bacterium]|nr:30S ribosome-binding factor RbfA [Bacteroidales bacterium]MDZ4203485.1 30S ribosome-binding factor RbfA [Bacteroidales bacterium]